MLVIAKPAGIATMGTSKGEPSLFDLVRDYLKRKYAKPGNVYLGVVSRLDAFVSGVLLFAKTSKAAGRLSDQFRRSSPRKEYLVVVEGEIQRSPGRIVSWLRKNDNRKRMESFSQEVANSKRAELTYDVLQTREGFSLLKIELITGRKHQIRVQMESIGCSIFGDRKYGGEEKFHPGIALHSRQLVVEHPVRKENIRFECPLPVSWTRHRQISKLILDGALLRPPPESKPE